MYYSVVTETATGGVREHGEHDDLDDALCEAVLVGRRSSRGYAIVQKIDSTEHVVGSYRVTVKKRGR